MQAWRLQRFQFVDAWLPIRGLCDHVLDYAYEWQGSLKYTIDKPTECFDWLAVELDGKLLTASHDESAVLVSDAKTGATIRYLSAGGEPVLAMVAWNGKLACISRDFEAIVWDVDQGQVVLTLDHPARVEFVTVFQKKLLTACTDHTLRLWDDGVCVAVCSHGPSKIVGLKVISAQAIAVRTMCKTTVYVFEHGEFLPKFETEELAPVLIHHPVYATYGFHTDGLLVFGEELAIFNSYKLNVWTHGEDDLGLFKAREIIVWPHGLIKSDASVLSACALYDGRIAASCMDQTIRLFDVRSGLCTKTIDYKPFVSCDECDSAPDKQVEHLVQLPDGKLAAALGTHVCVWDLETGRLFFRKHYGCEITTLLVLDAKLIVGCPTPCDGCECEPGYGCKTCGQLHALE